MSRNIPKRKLENRQFRLMQPLEIRQEEGKTESDFLVRGYAMKYEPYEFYEDERGIVYEEFRKEAFKDTDMTDIIMLHDHQGRVYARTSNETLKVGFDDIGMWIEANLSSNDNTKGLYADIKSGLITKMSWSFMAGQYHFDDETRTIVHDTIKKVYDVSTVGIPANQDTIINARKFVDGVINEFKTERSIERKRMLLLKIKIEEGII